MPNSVVKRAVTSLGSDLSSCGGSGGRGAKERGFNASSGFNSGDVVRGPSSAVPRLRSLENAENIPPMFDLDTAAAAAAAAASGAGSKSFKVARVDITAQSASQSRRRTTLTRTIRSPGGARRAPANPRLVSHTASALHTRNTNIQPAAAVAQQKTSQQQQQQEEARRTKVLDTDQNRSSSPGLNSSPYLRLPLPSATTSTVSGHQHNKPESPVQGDNCLTDALLPPVGHTVHGTAEPSPRVAFLGDGIVHLSLKLPRRGTSNSDEPSDSGSRLPPLCKVVHIFDTGSGSTFIYKNVGQLAGSTSVRQLVPSRNLSSLNLTGPPQTSSQTMQPQSASTANKGVAPTAASHVGNGANTRIVPRLESTPALESPAESTDYQDSSPTPGHHKSTAYNPGHTVHPTPPSTGPKAPAATLFGALSIAMQRTSSRSSARRALNFGTSTRVGMADLLDTNPVQGPRCPVISSSSGAFGQSSCSRSQLLRGLAEQTEPRSADTERPIRKTRAASRQNASSTANGRGRAASKRGGGKSVPSYIHKVTSSKSRQRTATCRYCHRQCKYRPELEPSKQCHPGCFDVHLYEPEENGVSSTRRVQDLHDALSLVTRDDSPEADGETVATDEVEYDDGDDEDDDEGIDENAPIIQLVRSKRTLGGEVKPARTPYRNSRSDKYSGGYSERSNHDLPNSDSTISVPDKAEFFGRHIESDSKNYLGMESAAHNGAPSSDFVGMLVAESVDTFVPPRGNAYANGSQSVALGLHSQQVSRQLLAEAEPADGITRFLANPPAHPSLTNLSAMLDGRAMGTTSSNPMMGGDSADFATQTLLDMGTGTMGQVSAALASGVDAAALVTSISASSGDNASQETPAVDDSAAAPLGDLMYDGLMAMFDPFNSVDPSVMDALQQDLTVLGSNHPAADLVDNKFDELINYDP